MKLLIDNALSRYVAASLREEGYDAVHVRDCGMADATDSDIAPPSLHEYRLLVSPDTDFCTMLARRGDGEPCIILFRGGANQLPDVQMGLLLANLPQLADRLAHGAVVIVEETRLRVRSLPIGD